MAEGATAGQLRRRACHAVPERCHGLRYRRCHQGKLSDQDLLTQLCRREEGTVEFYTQFGLNERQIDIIATATPKQHYYLVQPEGRRLFDLALGPVELSFFGVSGKDDLRRVRECAARYGADWPAYWLSQRGL